MMDIRIEKSFVFLHLYRVSTACLCQSIVKKKTEMDHAGIFVCFFELHSFCQEGKRLKDSNSCISIKLNAFYSLLWGRIRKVRRRISVNSTWQENSGSFVWRAAVCFVVRKSKPYTGNKEDHSRHTLAGNQLVCTRCRQLLAICLSIWAIVVGFSQLSRLITTTLY